METHLATFFFFNRCLAVVRQQCMKRKMQWRVQVSDKPSNPRVSERRTARLAANVTVESLLHTYIGAPHLGAFWVRDSAASPSAMAFRFLPGELGAQQSCLNPLGKGAELFLPSSVYFLSLLFPLSFLSLVLFLNSDLNFFLTRSKYQGNTADFLNSVQYVVVS